jgi:membrane protein DedA with SNARE-associated domain
MDPYGKLLGLFLVLVGGGIGLPLPEDVTLVGAGILVEQRVLGLRAAIAVGIAGIVAADWILYLFGRRYGAAIIARPAVTRLLGVHRVDGVRAAVLRHGAKAVFLARFMLGFRIATFLSAGMFGVPALRFAVAQAASSIIFVPAVVTLGLLFAHQAERVLHHVGTVEHWLVLAGLLGLALFLVLRARAARDLTDGGG